MKGNDAEHSQAVSANDDLKPLLVKFSKLALGEGNVSPDDKDEFDKLLNKAADKALNLKNRVPSLTADYETYVSSLVGLKKSVDQLHGPLDGKAFVKAVGDYSVANENFKQAAEAAKQSYLRSLALR